VVYNVFNNSSSTVTAISVTGKGISGFDRDGIDNYVDSNGADLHGVGTFNTVRDGPVYSPAYTTANNGKAIGTGGTVAGTDYTGYAFNGTSSNANSYLFTGDSASALNDTVNVTFGGGGIGAGDYAFISFEKPATGTAIAVGAPVPLPLPGNAAMGLALLGAVGGLTQLKKRFAR